MNKSFRSLGLAAIVLTTLPIVPNIHAQNGMDPIDRGCDKDSETLTSTSGRTYVVRIVQQREIRVEFRK